MNYRGGNVLRGEEECGNAKDGRCCRCSLKNENSRPTLFPHRRGVCMVESLHY